MGTATKQRPQRPSADGATLERRLERLIDELVDLTDAANGLFNEIRTFRQRVVMRDRISLARKVKKAAKAKASFTCRCQQD